MLRKSQISCGMTDKLPDTSLQTKGQKHLMKVFLNASTNQWYAFFIA